MENGKHKKSQISIFIIVATLIVVSLLFYFLIKGKIIAEKEIEPSIKPIYSHVQDCIKKTAGSGVIEIGKRGGYFITSENSLNNGFPVYFDKGVIEFPSKNDIEISLKDYFNNMLFFCTKNFIDFPDFDVEQEKIKSEVKLENGKVNFYIEYPLKITKDNKTYVFEEFDFSVPVRLDVIYNVSKEIIESQKNYPKDICFSCLESIAMENEVIIDIREYQDSFIFALSDLKSGIDEEAYVYYFAMRIDFENES